MYKHKLIVAMNIWYYIRQYCFVMVKIALSSSFQLPSDIKTSECVITSV